MIVRRLISVAVLAAWCGPAFADDRTDAIIAQTAAALASADFARKHCPKVRIDDGLIAGNAAEAGVTVDALRADEAYDDQAVALQSVVKQNGAVMVCVLLPSAHGGLARGILTPKR